MNAGLLQVLLHLLSEHALKSFEDFVLIVFLEHVGELCDLLALLTARQHFIAVDVELDDGLLAVLECALLQLDAAELVVALLSLTVDFVLVDLLDRERLATHVARDLVLLVYFHDDLGGLLHQAIHALWTLVVVSLTALLAEQLTAV